MNRPDIDRRLKDAALIAGPPGSVVDELMRRLPSAAPKVVKRSRWRRPGLAMGLTAFTGIAATVVLIFFFAGPSVRLTLADVQSAIKQQQWVHALYDAGENKEIWTNLQTGDLYAIRSDGGTVNVNYRANIRLWHWKNSGVIDQDTPAIFPAGASPRPWTPQTAWEQFVAPFENAAATSQPVAKPDVVKAQDTLNGIRLVRFDIYMTDAVGRRFLYSQLWADPKTKLPVRIKTRLQLGEREKYGKEWSTGEYDFPATGPADLFALGVPRGTPIVKTPTTAPADVQPIIDAINWNHDNFLKSYRAVVVTFSNNKFYPIDELDIIWRDGGNLRQDHHLPPVELQEKPVPPLPKFTSADLLKWSAQHEPIEKQLMDSQHEYSWISASAIKSSKPQVQVTFQLHRSFPLLATSSWPEEIQWPTRYFAPDFHLLPKTEDTPAGCIGLRSGEDGSTHMDYYVDPRNDYVCVKYVQWTKHGTQSTKTREYDLSDLHRIAGHVVAGTQLIRSYAEPERGLSANIENKTIDITPLSPSDYPLGIFAPSSLTTGATIEGY